LHEYSTLERAVIHHSEILLGEISNARAKWSHPM